MHNYNDMNQLILSRINHYYFIVEKILSVENLQSQLTDIKGQLKNITDDYKALKDDIMGIKRELNLHNKEFGDMCENAFLCYYLKLIYSMPISV